jgi:hypothetical protein
MNPRTEPVPLDAEEHAVLELRRVGLAVCADVEEWKSQSPEADAQGLARHISGLRAHLATRTGPLPGIDGLPQPLPLPEERKRVEQYLARRLEDTLRLGASTPLLRLRQAAGLSEFEVDLLLIAALPEESGGWGGLFSLLADNPALRRPTVHLVLGLSLVAGQRGAALQRLMEGHLLGYQLVRLHPPDAPLADRVIVVPAETWLGLCGVNAVEPVLAHSLVRNARPEVSPVLPEALAGRVEAIARHGELGAPIRMVLVGPPGSGRRTVASWLATRLRRPLVELRLPPGEAPAGWAAAAVAHALVRGAGLLLTANPAPGEAATVNLPVPPSMPCFLVLPERTDARGELFEGAVRLALSFPGVGEREELWRRALSRAGSEVPASGLLARRFRLGGGEIQAIAELALQRARLEARPSVTLGDISHVVRERPALRMESLARRRQSRATWEDLILPGDALGQLQDLVSRVRHHDRVFEEWGIAAHGGRQTSVLSLFTGPSGTGKTLAAEVIASQLELDLYSVDLSQVVSKYIGETEKNLARVFDAAEGTSAVLFFDEADGLFGKRTETRDSHDRYANLEVSYLLARLETFHGLAILASNLRQNIDSAFLRRMDFLVEFSPPDTEARQKLWERHLRSRAPVAEGIDIPLLASAFPISGAHIRNAVVGAAFLAAADGHPLGQGHLLAAMQREYEKLGRAFPSTLVFDQPPRRAS